MKKLGFGLMRLPTIGGNIDHEKVCTLVDRFMDAGFTYFDTAACYHSGHSEEAFKIAVSDRYPRSAYWITDKLSLFMLKDKSEIPSFFDKQLETLGVDYLDLYLIHSMRQNSFKQAEEWGAIDFMLKKKAEGKIKHIGFSFHDKADVLDDILTRHPEFEYVQLQINYLDWEDANVQSRLCHEIACKHGKKVLIMEPVKGGALAGITQTAADMLRKLDPDMSVASWAIRFAASLKNVEMVLSGMSNDIQVTDNIGFMDDFKPVSEQEKAAILDVAEVIRKTVTVPCTACKYCVDDCPQNINIPEYFKLYNDFKRFGTGMEARYKGEYKNIASKGGKASDCIGCGSCEEHCPQKISIRNLLISIANELE